MMINIRNTFCNQHLFSFEFRYFVILIPKLVVSLCCGCYETKSYYAILFMEFKMSLKILFANSVNAFSNKLN